MTFLLFRYVAEVVASRDIVDGKSLELKRVQKKAAECTSRRMALEARLVDLKSRWSRARNQNVNRGGALGDAAGALQVESICIELFLFILFLNSYLQAE